MRGWFNVGYMPAAEEKLRPRDSAALGCAGASILVKRGRLSTLRGRGLSIQLRAPARVYPEPTLARPLPRCDPEFGEMRAGEPKHAASALLFDEDKQARAQIVITERRRRSVRVSLPEGDESARLGRRGSRSPDMPRLVADLGNARLIVTVLQLGGHRNGHPYLGRVDLERTELHTAKLSHSSQ